MKLLVAGTLVPYGWVGAALVCLLWGCKESGPQPDSLGGIGEVLVVSDTRLWEGEEGVLLRKALSCEQYGLPQPEPWFRLLPIQDLGANKYQQRHRMILHVRIGSAGTELPDVLRQASQEALASKGIYQASVKDVQAFPQRVIWLVAKDRMELRNYLAQKGDRLRSWMLKADKALVLAKLQRLQHSDTLGVLLRDSLGLECPALPADYRIKGLRKGFVWLSREIPEGSMNLCLWLDSPVESRASGTYGIGEEELLAKRNAVMKEWVPGPSPGSYYVTETLLTPEVVATREGSECRGLWKVEGDFMGGPFVHRQWNANGRTLSAEAFVYAPNQPKRAWLRELEALMESVQTVGPYGAQGRAVNEKKDG